MTTRPSVCVNRFPGGKFQYYWNSNGLNYVKMRIKKIQSYIVGVIILPTISNRATLYIVIFGEDFIQYFI